MTDVLIQMQRTAWRFIEFPITARKYGFQQEQARHRYIFRDVQLIESLGTENPTYRYTIPFREDIARGPYKHLFTEVYPEFLAACLDRTRGVLSDPVHGDVNCKLVSLTEDLDVNRRDGIDVEAEWIVAPLESEVTQDLGTQIQTLKGAADNARKLDDAIKKVDWKQLPSPEATVSPLDFVSSVGNQVEVVASKVTAAFADAAFRLEKTIATIDRLKNPDTTQLRQQARRLQAALFRLEDQNDVTGTHPVQRVTTTANKSLSAMAAELGMTVEQFVRLNPQCLRSPLVRAGTELRSFSDTSPAPKK
jgi:hypothetical protein